MSSESDSTASAADAPEQFITPVTSYVSHTSPPSIIITPRRSRRSSSTSTQTPHLAENDEPSNLESDSESSNDVDGGDSADNNLERKVSIAQSVASTIEENLGNTLHQTATKQEELIQNEITPMHLEFWKPRNIMSVEDTPFSNRYLVSLMVIVFSIPGNLARDSMQKLTNYDNSYINYSGGTVVWINFAACFIMSWCNNSVGFWSHILKGSGKTNMKQLALHTGITGGLCGSFSTLSSAIIEIFFKTIDIVQNPLPNNGYKVMEFFASSIITFGIPVFGHVLGRQFALVFDAFFVPKFSRFLTYQNVRIFELSCVLIGIAAIIANIVLSAALSVTYFYKETYSFAILMGVFGALLRFRLSVFNGRFFAPWFPSGTLLANVLGCSLISIMYLLLLGYKNSDDLLINNKVHQFILKGFASGFCGSLTTMSSFVNELYNLENPLFQHTYFWATFTPCFIVILLIDGSYAWTRGFKHV